MLLQKGICPYKHMVHWEKSSEKEDFYSHLYMENVIDADYAHAKRVCKDFEIKNLGDYHGLYVQSYTLLSPDLFENF